MAGSSVLIVLLGILLKKKLLNQKHHQDFSSLSKTSELTKLDDVEAEIIYIKQKQIYQNLIVFLVEVLFQEV